MKSKKKELDVDFIGGLGELTELEEKKLSEYFNKKKLEKRNTKPSLEVEKSTKKKVKV